MLEKVLFKTDFFSKRKRRKRKETKIKHPCKLDAENKQVYSVLKSVVLLKNYK